MQFILAPSDQKCTYIDPTEKCIYRHHIAGITSLHAWRMTSRQTANESVIRVVGFYTKLVYFTGLFPNYQDIVSYSKQQKNELPQTKAKCKYKQWVYVAQNHFYCTIQYIATIWRRKWDYRVANVCTLAMCRPCLPHNGQEKEEHCVSLFQGTFLDVSYTL